MGRIFRYGLTLCLALSFGMVMSACERKRSKPTFTYMPDMAYSPAIKPGEKEATRMPVAGTIHQDQEVYQYEFDPEGAGRNLKNPLSRTKDNILTGQKYYNIYCIVCHGPKGLGNGSVIGEGLFTRPPSLASDKVRDWTDGSMYHVMTIGQGNMSSYASQVTPEQRWAIIHYIRALQKAARPTDADIQKVEGK